MLKNYDLLIMSSGGWENYNAYSRLLSNSQGLLIDSASEKVKEAVNKLGTSYEPKAVEESLKEANSVLNRLAPVIPLTRQKEFLAVSADLKNCKMTQYDAFIHNIWDIHVK